MLWIAYHLLQVLDEYLQGCEFQKIDDDSCENYGGNAVIRIQDRGLINQKPFKEWFQEHFHEIGSRQNKYSRPRESQLEEVPSTL